MKVKDCMCNDVCYVTPDTKIFEVAKLMNQNHIGSIPVIDEDDGICGIITDRDIILRSISCDKDVKNTPVSDVMTTNVCTCKEDDDIKKAQQKMSTNQIRRIPVCGADNKLKGILTLGNLVQKTEQLGKENVCKTVENICECKSNKKNAE